MPKALSLQASIKAALQSLKKADSLASEEERPQTTAELSKHIEEIRKKLLKFQACILGQQNAIEEILDELHEDTKALSH